ncbi:translocation/assembly module TamB [Luteolibacter flavescens]|uniref:Translocation/assembly module TamB n=1 Tax=Luteolibacter flavescens TaxID=1859460 RepID=A0ABT3FT97_9BACT|nr:translocation/assembly module TamB [Luteolibacter flavescens]MCW1886794.1 translocation/assembly module TamB [Luteolibacter flavescens]
MSTDGDAPPQKKKRRRGRKSLIALVVISGGLVWLNGPGWRWLGGIGARKALEGSGLTADFDLKGTLLGGIRVERLSVSGGPIRKLEIGSVGPLYQLKKIVRGELDGVAVEKIDAIIDLAADPLPSRGGPKEENPDDLPTTLKKIRAMLLPMDLRAADLRFQLVRGEESLVVLDTSTFSHAPGSDEFRLSLGQLGVTSGYSFEAQESVIVWGENDLSLDRFDVTPRLGVRDVQVEIGTGGQISGTGVVQIEDSRLILAGNQSSATVKLEGDPLVVQEAVKNFALELPAEATVRRLEASIEGFDKTPDQWQATATAEIGAIRYEDWQAETLVLDAEKDGSQGTVNFSLAALDSSVAGNAALTWRNLSAGQWTDFEATAKATVPQLSPIYAVMKEKFEFAPKEAPPLPASSLALDATADMGPEGIRSATAKWLLSAEKDAPSLAGENKWTPDGKLGGTLGTDGLRATYALDLTAKNYEASAVLDAFQPERLAAWAAPAGVTLPTGMNATATWQGSGEFGPKPHRGTFDIPSFEMVREDTPPLIVRTKGNYNWPQEVVLDDVTAIAEGQTINASATFADRILKIPRIEWKDGEQKLVGGQAEIPVPEEMKTTKDFLKQEIPLNVFLETDWIDHARLSAWLPEKKSPLASGSGRVRLVVTGTPAAPKIDLDADVRGVSLPDQPDVPVTDASITLDGADGTLAINGQIKPAGYEPVVITGKTAFKPGEWAENPETALKEKLEARANIPRLNLATFAKFVPTADQLSGTVEGNFTATGTIGEPDLAGELRLSQGVFSLKDSPVPPVTNANALIRLVGKEVRLQTLSLEAAGGTLTGTGNVGLADAANPTFDVNLRGTALPLQRDESMIVRADANLTLRGNLEQAGISGTVDIVDSLFYRDFEILPVRVPFTAPSRPSLPSIDPDEKAADFPEPFANWTLDVMVRTRDPLFIRGNLAKGEAIANIRFGGTLSNIQPQGNAIIGEAEAKLPFSTLKVSNGAITFTSAGGLNPELNIRGTSNIGRYEVNVYFYGPVNAPKTALTSDPPLPESEIMTLLATGTTSDGLEDGQAATMKAAQLLIEEWRKGRLPFAEQVAKVLEVINRVDVRIGEDDPLTGKRLNSATIEVTEKIYVSGSVDKQSNTRVLGAFVLRFK